MTRHTEPDLFSALLFRPIVPWRHAWKDGRLVWAGQIVQRSKPKDTIMSLRLGRSKEVHDA